MTVTINYVPAKLNITKEVKKTQKGHSPVLALPDLTTPGFLFRGHLMGLWGVSHTCLYKWISKNIIPAPSGFLGTKPYWRKDVILAHLNK